jgi:predicted RecA/RadA family phage recombinase
MRNYVQRGDNITIPAAPRDIESGEGVLIGELFGVATGPVASGDSFVLLTAGVVELGKDTTSAFDLGDTVGWDDGDHIVSDDPADFLIGVAVEDAGTSATTVRVKLRG